MNSDNIEYSNKDYSIIGNKQKTHFQFNKDFSPTQIKIIDTNSPYVNEPRYIDNLGNKLSLLDIINILNNDTRINGNTPNDNYKDSFANNQISNNKKLIGISMNQVLNDIIIAQNKGINIEISSNIENIINIITNLKDHEILLNIFDVLSGSEAIILKNDKQLYLGDKIINIAETFKKFINNKEYLNRKELGEICTSLKLYELLKENNKSSIINIDETTIKEIYDYINKGFVYQNALNNQSMLDFLYAFTKYFARINGIIVQVEFFNSVKDDMGYSDNGIIGLNKRISIVNPHTLYTSTLETIFHEVFHELQRKEKDTNKYTLGNTIEKVLKEHDRRYYGDNYKTILYEVDAKYNSYLILLNYLRDLVPENYEEYYQEYIEKIDNEIGNYEKNVIGNYNLNKNRYNTGNKILSRDAALEMIVKEDPQVLEKNPILKYIFNDDGTRKNINELNDIVKEHASDRNTHIVDMINYWVRTCSYSLESIIKEYFVIYMNGIDELSNEFKEIINTSLDQKLLEVILLEMNSSEEYIFVRINNILKNYQTISSQEGIAIDEFIKYIEIKCNRIVQGIDKIKAKKKRSIIDRLLGSDFEDKINYEINSVMLANDEYLSDKEIAEELAWYKEIDSKLGINPNDNYSSKMKQEELENNDNAGKTSKR